MEFVTGATTVLILHTLDVDIRFLSQILVHIKLKNTWQWNLGNYFVHSILMIT